MSGTGITTSKRCHRAAGFSLLELLVALSVASILLTVGVPSLRAIVMNSRLTAGTNDFVASINLARSAAVRYQRAATVCRSTNFDAAVPACAAGTDWTPGWIVWVDKDRDATTDAGEVVSVHEPLTGSLTLNSTATNRFTYDARGLAVVGGDNVTLCDGRTGETGRVVSVNGAGRISLSQVACP